MNTENLKQLGQMLLKAERTDWLDMDGVVKLYKEHKIANDLNSQELEAHLKPIFSQDELSLDGMTVVGLNRRLGWDLVFMIRFFPYFKSANYLESSFDKNDDPTPALQPTTI